MTRQDLHQAMRARLVDLAIGGLSPQETRELEAHLAGCSACRVELDALRLVKEGVASLPPIEAPERGEAILVAAARQAADEARSRRRLGLPSWFWSMALGGAGAAAVVVLALQLTSGAKGPLDAAREPEATRGAPAGLARPPQAPDSPAPASPPALAQAEAEAGKEAGPPPAALVPASPPPAKADAWAQASAEAGRTELRAAPARKRERLAEAALRRDELDAATPVPAVASAAPPAPAQEAAPGQGAIGFAASRGEPPGPEQALSKASRKAATSVAPAATAPPAVGREEEASHALADAAPAPRAAAGASAPAERSAAPGLFAEARPETRSDPGCAAEQRRTLWRDGAGAVVRRLRIGRHQGAPVVLDETFGPDGRIVSARVEAAGRLVVVDRAGLEAARFVPVPGLRVAATAADAERDPPACGAWPR